VIFLIGQAIFKELLLKVKNMKWDYRNTLTALNYSGKIKAIYNGYLGTVKKGGYGTDAVGRSRYVSEPEGRVEFTSNNYCVSIKASDIKSLAVAGNVIDISDLCDKEDAYFEIMRRIESFKKKNAIVGAVAL
jgi:hypothetical protein